MGTCLNDSCETVEHLMKFDESVNWVIMQGLAKRSDECIPSIHCMAETGDGSIVERNFNICGDRKTVFFTVDGRNSSSR